MIEASNETINKYISDKQNILVGINEEGEEAQREVSREEGESTAKSLGFLHFYEFVGRDHESAVKIFNQIAIDFMGSEIEQNQQST